MSKSFVGIVKRVLGCFQKGTHRGREDRNFTLLEILKYLTGIRRQTDGEELGRKEMNIHIVSGSGLILFYRYLKHLIPNTKYI